VLALPGVVVEVGFVLMFLSLLGTWPVPQASLYVAPPAAPTGRLPLVPWTALVLLRNLGSGAFGDVALMDWSARGLTVAVKCNGTDCANGAAIDNERRLYEKLLTNPHENILPVYGICADAPDRKMRLVMKYCEKGSLDSHLAKRAKPEVSVTPGGWNAVCRCDHLSPFHSVCAMPRAA
jgi:hypothetical protein